MPPAPVAARPLLHADQILAQESVDLDLAMEYLAILERGTLEVLEVVAGARKSQ